MTISNLIHKKSASNIPAQKRSRLERSLISLHDDIEHVWHDFFDGAHFFPLWKNEGKNPPVDIIENGKNFIVNVDLAGVDPDDIEVFVTDGLLAIEGQKEEEVENKEGSYLYQETQYGSFQRTISLPDSVNCDKAEAKFKNGVLKVTIPKKAKALEKPRKIEVKKAA